MADPTLPTSPGRLRIGRLVAEYRVSEDHPFPAALGRQLNEALVSRLADALSNVMRQSAIGRNDPSVWLIRRMGVESDVSTEWNADEVSRTIGLDVARAVAGVIGNGADGQDVVWFPDRAAYLAAFLLDRAAGDADQWRYRAFDGLRLLPASAALRTAMLDDPATGRIALSRLAADAQLQVLKTLNRQDAESLLDAFARIDTDDDGHALEHAWAAWRPMTGGPSGVSEAHDGLRLYLAAWSPESNGPALRSAVLALVRFARRLQESGMDPLAAIHDGHASDDANVLFPLSTADAQWVDGVRDALLSGGRSSDPHADAFWSRGTPFGAAFLLMPMLARLPLDAATENWPALQTVNPTAVARFFLLAKCFGPEQTDAFNDPLLRDLFAMPPGLRWDDVRDWLTERSPHELTQFTITLDAWETEHGPLGRTDSDEADANDEDSDYLIDADAPDPDAAADAVFCAAARALLRTFAHRLPGFAQSRLPYLFENFLRFGAEVQRLSGRFVVRIGRPPLHLVLSMTGIARDAYAVPWQDVPFEVGFAAEGTG